MQSACDELDNLSALVQKLGLCSLALYVLHISLRANESLPMGAAGKGIIDKS